MKKIFLKRVNQINSFKRKDNKKCLELSKHKMLNVKEKNTLIVLGNKKGKFSTFESLLIDFLLEMNISKRKEQT